jgi:iron complex transport system ATP-binding protein
MIINNTAISLKDICFSYIAEGPMVLDHVSVDIPAGSITALLGPNGSGKSTLLHLLLGLLPPAEGKIHLLGRPNGEYTRKESSQAIGLVPQDEHAAFDLSVLEYVLLGRAPYLGLLDMPKTDDRRLARDALAAVGIEVLERRHITSLSGGERQLATIARALAQEPMILLLDEPTSHLDLANARRILHVLRSFKDAGKTVILTTHDPNAASAIADHVILLRAGKVLASTLTADALTCKNLSSTYGVEVEVIKAQDRLIVLAHG